jgi:hypothetical protein
MAQYTRGLIDFELINRRNVSVLKPEDLSLKNLLNINVLSIFKLIDQYDFDVPVLLFDSSPYFKSEFITEYKTNRKRPTIEDLELLDKESKDYEKQYNKIKHDILKNEIALEAKSYIINNWTHFTIPLIYKGLEADDMSFMISRILNDKTIHLTKDTDYINHIYTNHDVLIISKKGNTLHKYDPVYESQVPLEMQKVFHELFKSSHNGIDVKKLKLSNEEIYTMYNDKTLEEETINRINGLNPLTYLSDEVKSFLLANLNKGLNPNVDYLKSYKYLSHKRIYDFQQRQLRDDFDDMNDLI